jgi:hypothetical protein
MKDVSKKRNFDEKGELLNSMKKADKGAGVESKKKSKCSKEDVKNVINKRQCKHCIEKSGTIGATTPPNTSP